MKVNDVDGKTNEVSIGRNRMWIFEYRYDKISFWFPLHQKHKNIKNNLSQHHDDPHRISRATHCMFVKKAFSSTNYITNHIKSVLLVIKIYLYIYTRAKSRRYFITMNQINMTKTHQARSMMSIVALIYCITFFAATSTTCAFTATTMLTRTTSLSKSQQQPFGIDNDGVTVVVLYGYLDNLSRDELYDTRGDPNPDLYAESREATQMSKDQVDRYGPGDLSQFVDFGDEFDGGDGRTYCIYYCIAWWCCLISGLLCYSMYTLTTFFFFTSSPTIF